MKTLEHLKENDVILVERWEYGLNNQLFLGRVIKRTPNRLTIEYNGYEQIFTLDGQPYPRPKHFYKAPNILMATEENMIKYHRCLAIRRLKQYTNQMYELLHKGGSLNKLSEMEIRNAADVLEKYLNILKEN